MPLALLLYNVCPAAPPVLTVVAVGVPLLPDGVFEADAALAADVSGAGVLMLIGPLFGLFSGV